MCVAVVRRQEHGAAELGDRLLVASLLEEAAAALEMKRRDRALVALLGSDDRCVDAERGRQIEFQLDTLEPARNRVRARLLRLPLRVVRPAAPRTRSRTG